MKTRMLYLLVTLIVMILGICSRKFMFIFPDRIAPFVGDALWAMMVYFGFRFLFPSFKFLQSFILAMVFSFFIEISQLYQTKWINNIRPTTLGGLVLGHGFLYADLISYTIGIVLALGLDYLLHLKLKR